LPWSEKTSGWEGIVMKKKTNFDRYLEEQLLDKGFEERFRKAGEAWDVAL